MYITHSKYRTPTSVTNKLQIVKYCLYLILTEILYTCYIKQLTNVNILPSDCGIKEHKKCHHIANSPTYNHQSCVSKGRQLHTVRQAK